MRSRRDLLSTRLTAGLATVASALNANDPALARIAAVHLKIPDLPTPAARDALVAEDALIKYARDEGGSNNWNPALHPRAGVPPNSGWFAPTRDPQNGSSQNEASQNESSHGESRLRFAENEDHSRRADAAPTTNEWVKPSPRNPIGDQPGHSEFWSNVWPAVRNWLQQPVPEHDLESGKVVGSGRAGKPSRLTWAFRLRPRRP